MATPHEDPFRDPIDDDAQGDEYEDDDDLEPSERAMQEMMGFSNFTGSKRPVPKRGGADRFSTGDAVRGTGANSQPVTQRDENRNKRSRHPSTSTSSVANTVATQFLPASLPPKPLVTPSTTFFSGTVTHDPTTDWERNPDSRSRTVPGRGERTYTNPITGITLSADELREYAGGRNIAIDVDVEQPGSSQDYVTVYFQPSFIEDDPWKGLI